MRKILLLLLFSTAVFGFTENVAASDVIIPDWCTADPEDVPDNFDMSTCDSSSSEIDLTSLYDEYNERIYKDTTTGLWYGVINVENFEVGHLNSGFGEVMNSIFLSFTRDTEQLVSITIDYTTQAMCNGFDTIFGCIGTMTPASSGSEEIYDKESDGGWLSFFNTSKIEKVDTSTYDYVIFPDEEKALDEVTIIQLSYVLTDAEIDAVLADIQVQFNKEIQYIMYNTSLTIDEKEVARLDLINEYASYEIDYGETITSLCTDDEACTAVAPDFTKSDNPLTWDSIKAYVIGFVTTISLGTLVLAGLYYFGTDILSDLASTYFNFMVWLGHGVANSLYEYIAKPILTVFFKGVMILAKLIFWWFPK